MRLRALPDRVQENTFNFASKKCPGRNEYDLVVGQEYVAMGLSFINAHVIVEVATQGGFLMPVPLRAFAIVSGRPSAHWEARVESEENFRLWPPAFYEPFFHSDLADREPTIVAEFNALRRLIEEEDRRFGLAAR